MATIDPAQKLGAIAHAIKPRLATIAGLNVYDHERLGRAFTPPCVMVGAVDVERTGVEEAESELGRDDWSMSWALTLYVALNDPATAYSDARILVGRLIAAFDADQKLGGEVLEAKLVSAEMGVNDDDENRRLIVVECELEALALMPR